MPQGTLYQLGPEGGTPVANSARGTTKKRNAPVTTIMEPATELSYTQGFTDPALPRVRQGVQQNHGVAATAEMINFIQVNLIGN